MMIKKLQRDQMDQAIELLSNNSLPIEDVLTAEIELFGCIADDTVIACIGLERFDELGLLRSLVVSDTKRGSGLGVKLVNFLEKYCTQAGISSLYLLTETAEDFFEKRNYLKMDRAQTPQKLMQSAEFSHLCPDTAVLMRKKI